MKVRMVVEKVEYYDVVINLEELDNEVLDEIKEHMEQYDCDVITAIKQKTEYDSYLLREMLFWEDADDYEYILKEIKEKE